MNESTFLAIAVIVFLLLLVGLGLTMAEFRHGEPRAQQKRAERREQRSER